MSDAKVKAVLAHQGIEDAEVNLEESLAHYGVSGMKWGKRKQKLKDSTEAWRKDQLAKGRRVTDLLLVGAVGSLLITAVRNK